MRAFLLKAALKLAATRFGGWFFTTVTPPLDRLLLRSSQGRWNMGLGVVPICLLTTNGRRSGRQLATPLLYMRDEQHVYLVASGGGSAQHPAWYWNAKDREVRLTISGQEHTATATEVGPEHYQHIWQQFVAFNPGFEAYKARVERQIPILQIPVKRAP